MLKKLYPQGSTSFIPKKKFEKGLVKVPNISNKSFSLPPPKDELSTLKSQAILYLQQNKFHDANHIFPRIAEKTDPKHFSFLKIFKFYQHLQSAVMKHNNETDILPEFIESLRIDDDYHTIPLLFHLSQDYIQIGEFGKSITLLGFALEIATNKISNDPLNKEIKNLIFYTYEQMGHNYLSLYEFGEAEKIFLKALSLKEEEDVDTTIFLAYISYCQYHFGKFEECNKTVERNLEIVKKELARFPPEEEEKILIDSVYKSFKSLLYIEEKFQDYDRTLKLHERAIEYSKEIKVKELENFFQLSLAQFLMCFDKVEESTKILDSIDMKSIENLPLKVKNERKGIVFEIMSEIHKLNQDTKKLIENEENYHEFLRESFVYKDVEHFDISKFEEDLMNLYKQENDVDSMTDLFYLAVGDKLAISQILSKYLIDNEKYKEAIPILKGFITACEKTGNGGEVKIIIKSLLMCFEKTGYDNQEEIDKYVKKRDESCNIL
jgi:tetratricopeptide (TPR) repeat protein